MPLYKPKSKQELEVFEAFEAFCADQGLDFVWDRSAVSYVFKRDWVVDHELISRRNVGEDVDQGLRISSWQLSEWLSGRK